MWVVLWYGLGAVSHPKQLGSGFLITAERCLGALFYCILAFLRRNYVELAWAVSLCFKRE